MCDLYNKKYKVYSSVCDLLAYCEVHNCELGTMFKSRYLQFAPPSIVSAFMGYLEPVLPFGVSSMQVGGQYNLIADNSWRDDYKVEDLLVRLLDTDYNDDTVTLFYKVRVIDGNRMYIVGISNNKADEVECMGYLIRDNSK